jgi:GTPase SAR1 family protein
MELILIGNKTDLNQYREISYEEGAKLAEENNMNFIEISAKDNNNI